MLFNNKPLSRKNVVSTLSIFVLMFSIMSLLVLYGFKDIVEKHFSGLGFIITMFLISLVTISIMVLFKPSSIIEKIFHYIFYSLGILLSIIVVIYSLHALGIVDTTSKISYSSIGSGVIAIIGIYILLRRLKNQDTQIDIQIEQKVDDKFNSAISLLGNSESSARTGAIYLLYELAVNEEKYRLQIMKILCSHIRSKTQEILYQEHYKYRPSNEIQTCISLLFSELRGSSVVLKEGLYSKFNTGLIDADVSYSYLVGANFTNTNCRGVIFNNSKLQKSLFINSLLDDAQFKWCHMQLSSFRTCKMFCTQFNSAKLQGSCFFDVRCAHSEFIFTNMQGAYFLNLNMFNKSNTYLLKLQGAHSLDCDKFNLKDRVGQNTQIENLPKLDGIECGILEDSEEFQDVINGNW